MADYRGVILTNQGNALIAKAQTGAVLHFTRVKLGDGEIQPGSTLEGLTDLVNPKLSLPITHLQADSKGTCLVRTNITNEGLSQGFFVKEVGLFAMDPDLGEEVLYAVTTAKNADYIPPDGSATVINNQFNFNILVGNATNIQANVNPSGLVNQADFDDHVNKTDVDAHPESIRVLDQNQVPQGNEGELSKILDWFAYQFKSISGKQNWWEDPATSLEQLHRDYTKILVQLEVDGRAPGSSGTFIDTFVGKPNKMTLLDASADLTNAVNAGATTLPLVMINGTFIPNTQIIIEDDVNREEVLVTAIDETSITVSGLSNSYKKGARITRSNVVVDTIKQEMGIGDWSTYSISEVK